MSITNYDTLTKAIEDWSHRDDLGTKIDTFLQLAETEIYSNPDEPLQLLGMETYATASTTTTSRFLALPDNINLQKKIEITLDSYNYKIDYVSPQNLKSQESSPGVPCQFTISNNQIEFDKIPDDTYTITVLYSRQPEPLSLTNQTNEVLTKYPNIYLYGALAQVFTFAQDTQQEQKYSVYFLNAIRDANNREKMTKFPNGVNVRSPRVV